MQDCKEHDILVVTTTVATQDQARELARGLLGERLAACVQVDADVWSVYRWEGQVHEDAELRLVIKTAPERADALQAWLAIQHPYTLPQITTVRTAASAAYGRWVREAVGSA